MSPQFYKRCTHILHLKIQQTYAKTPARIINLTKKLHFNSGPPHLNVASFALRRLHHCCQEFPGSTTLGHIKNADNRWVFFWLYSLGCSACTVEIFCYFWRGTCRHRQKFWHFVRFLVSVIFWTLYHSWE